MIPRKIIKTVAIKCHTLRLKCAKFDFVWGSAPDPVRGAYSALPGLLAGFGDTSKGRGKGEEMEKGGRGKEKRRRRKGKRGEGQPPSPNKNSGYGLDGYSVCH